MVETTSISKRAAWGGAAIVVLAGAVALYVNTRSAAGQCYLNQAGVIEPARLSKVRWIYGMGSDHSTCIVGEDGACYGMRGKRPTSGPETRYQKPGAGAGQFVQDWWHYYWETPETHNADGSWTSSGCTTLNTGTIAQPPPSSLPTCMSSTQAIPHAVKASGSFNPQWFTCGGDPTPTPTAGGPTPACVPVTVTPATICVTPTPRP